MTRRIYLIFTAFLSLLVLGACSDRPTYRNSSYSWSHDGIQQDTIRAYARDAFNIVSNYPDAEYADGVWTLAHDISGYASYQAPTALEEAIYNMALEETVIAIEPDGTLRTGKEWGGVWTRDVSYSIVLGMSHAQTEAAKTSLMRKVDSKGRIIQDTGTGGSWPCSTDRMTWVLAAWEIYKVTGDRKWFDTIYPVIKRSLEDDLATVVDSETGMIRGESSYLDWRQQEYPAWMKPVDIYQSENLGTECVHYMAYSILSRMEEIAGGTDAARYSDTARGIAEGINRRLWMEDKGFYAQYLYGRRHPIISPRFETLGEALAILYGIASPRQARSIVANAPCEDFGTPCFYPQIPDMFPYHNDGMWPFVQSFWNLAAARTGNPDVVLHGIATIYRAASFFLTNKENMVVYNGKWQGTAINSSRQLWSIAGSMGVVYNVLFGMEFMEDCLAFHPMVPRPMSGTRKLTGLRYRNAILDITIEGHGAGIRSFTIDGAPSESRVCATLEGKHNVRIVLDGKFPCKGINMVENAYSLPTPQTRMENGILRWESVEGAQEYAIVRNGTQTAVVAACEYAPETEGEYQVIAKAGGRFDSFASEPVNHYENCIVIDLENFGRQEKAPYAAYRGEAYLPITRKINTNLSIPVHVARDGWYFVNFLYCNANGDYEQENKCANRTLSVDGKKAGLAVFPQCGDHTYSLWQWSNPVKVFLAAGDHSIALTFGPENENMNILVNDAALDLMLITPFE